MKKLLFITLIFTSCNFEGNYDVIGNSTEEDTSSLRKNVSNPSIEPPLKNFKATTIFFENNSSELSMSQNEKNNILNKVSKYFEFYLKNEFENRKPLVERVKFLELNNDGVPDLIYLGPSGAEGFITSILLSENNDYKEPINFYQYLSDMQIIEGKLHSITIVDPGCCAEYIQKELHYSFDESMQHKLEYSRARIHGAISDQYLALEKPIDFIIESNYNRMRGTPLIDDTSLYVYDNTAGGNTIAIFEKGQKGKAWYIDSSDPEREWWYVEMEPINDTLTFDLFSHIETEKIHRVGWMSNKFLFPTNQERNIH